MHDHKIGGDAASLPVPDGFATKMALHCSLEHFESDSDIRFFQEAHRVLSPGGKLVVVPLYLTERYFILTIRLSQFQQGYLFLLRQIQWCLLKEVGAIDMVVFMMSIT